MSINMTQNFIFETDDLKSFESVLTTIIPVLFRKNSEYVKLHIKKESGFWNDGKYESRNNIPPNPTRVWIATLENYKGSYKKGIDSCCDNYTDMVQKAMNRVQSFDVNCLNKTCGDGFNNGFNSFDGSIGIAYRMHYEPSGGWNKLVLSMTHAYYGK